MFRPVLSALVTEVMLTLVSEQNTILKRDCITSLF
jgi:hypothetical protein